MQAFLDALASTLGSLVSILDSFVRDLIVV
jgi:hypothetical protein